LGQPFQNYIFLAAKAEQPSSVLLCRQIRLFRLYAALYRSGLEGNEPAEAAEGEEAAQKPLEANWVPVGGCNGAGFRADRLGELIECLQLCVAGVSGQVFFAENADLLEDMVSRVYGDYVVPLVKLIENRRHRHALREMLLESQQLGELDNWTGVLRKALPALLKLMLGTMVLLFFEGLLG